MLTGMDVTPGVGVDFGAVGSVLMLAAFVYVAGAALVWVQGFIMAGVTQRTVYRMRRDVELMGMRAQASARIMDAVQLTNHSIVVIGRDGRIQWANRGFECSTGYRFDEMAGVSAATLNSGRSTRQLDQLAAQCLAEGSNCSADVAMRAKSGATIWQSVDTHALLDGEGKPTHALRSASTSRSG